MNNERGPQNCDRNGIRAPFTAPGEHGVALAKGWFQACRPRFRNGNVPAPGKPAKDGDLIGSPSSEIAEGEASQAD
ncbi:MULTISPECIES: hypothetical protein [unclassified Sphingomonas]|uniref:hypothetical protein n=1 Tax=unclassified Sphingomonas TaxID=196159 RepID=UPI0022699E95|nr:MULTISPECIES: hypothetical protein [unclassified Sphingomonas]